MGTAERNAVELLRDQVKGAVQYLEETVGDLTQDDAHWIPPGTALPAGAVYAHLVTSQDAIVNGMLRGAAPLFAAEWAGRTGLSELPPEPDPKTPGFYDWTAWSRRVKVDLAAHRTYARAVYAATDAWMATLSDPDLERPVDLSVFGMGQQTAGFMLINAVVGHAFSHAGEIACLKGLQGRKGSPF